MRFWNNDALANVEGVLLRVEEALKLSGRFIDDGITPLPMGEGAMAALTAASLLPIGEAVVEAPAAPAHLPTGDGVVAAPAAASVLPAGEGVTAALAAASPLPIALACERDNSEMQARQGELAGEGQGEGRA